MTNFHDQPYDPFNTKTGNNRLGASRPGLIRLSQERLQRMHAEIYEVQRPRTRPSKPTSPGTCAMGWPSPPS